jgi:hypothetical protein
MNNTYPDTQNPIFKALHKIYTRYQYTTPSPSPTPPSRYTINVDVGMMYIHNIHTQGKTTTPYAVGVNDIVLRGKVSI